MLFILTEAPDNHNDATKIGHQLFRNLGRGPIGQVEFATLIRVVSGLALDDLVTSFFLQLSSLRRPGLPPRFRAV